MEHADDVLKRLREAAHRTDAALRALVAERDEALAALRGVMEGIDDYWAENFGAVDVETARALLAKHGRG